MLYGASPVSPDPGLRPVMTLRSALLAVRRIPPGDAVGYNATWVSPRGATIGTVMGGYGDGYPRHAPSGTPVLVNGRTAPLVGRVSMDMITVDLSEQPEARAGDEVVLWGRGLPVAEIAARAGTISYELLTRVSPRPPRRYY
jgi:alanine racemase